MKYLVLTALLLNGTAFGKDHNLSCIITQDSQEVYQTEVNLLEGHSNLKFAEAVGFQFLLSSYSNDRVELQIFNAYDPSRSYASSKLSETGTFIELNLWRREFILGARCVKQ